MRHLSIFAGALFAAAKTETESQAGAPVETVAQTPAPETPEWLPLGDMSIKKLGVSALDAVRQGKQVYLCRIFGEAVDFKIKDAKSGDPYTYLIGDFRAVNSAGAKFESTKLFLPGRLLEEIEGALKSTGNPVEFGYDIYSTPDASSSTGYKYAAKALIKTESSDRVAKLAAAVMAKPLPKN